MQSEKGRGVRLGGVVVLVCGLLVASLAWAAADTWVDPVGNIEFIKVAGGCFNMGQRQSDREELERVHGAEFYEINFADELPAHEVCLEPFYISRNEVTVAQYKAFMADSGHINDSVAGGGCYAFNRITYRWLKKADISWQSPGFAQKGDEPVVCVSWNDAHSFADWLTRKQAEVMFVLPSEAQWEFAARAGEDGKYAGGDDLAELAWHVDNSKKTTHPVGTKKANANGLGDMSGNVWEWVEDWYDPRYYQVSSKDNPLGPAKGIYKGLRGGGWNSFAHNCRPANRDQAGPTHADTNLGFRLVAKFGAGAKGR